MKLCEILKNMEKHVCGCPKGTPSLWVGNPKQIPSPGLGIPKEKHNTSVL